MTTLAAPTDSAAVLLDGWISRNPVDAYAARVVSGDVSAGKYHRLACERHIRDRQREGRGDFPYVFRWEMADRFLRFMQKLKHYKGEWAGQPIEPSEFQEFRLGSIFGWRHEVTGLRRFTTAYNELPRKNGKSLEAAVVAIYVTFFEGEPGSEGYCIATKEKQAADVVFADVKKLIKSSGLSKRLKVQVKNVHHEPSASKLEPLGSDSETLDGLNPQSITTDELHAFKSRGLIDVMESATGARRNPLHFQITTAGNDPVSVCGDQHDYACKILDGVLQDAATEAFFACIAHADPEDDWLDEATWRKANPHYGVSVKPDDMLKLALKAKNMPSAAAEFKQKRLNLWVNADAPWLSMEGWRKGQSAWTMESLAGEPCWGGMDLSSKIDLTAFVLLFPPKGTRLSWRALLWAFTPEETLIERAHRDRAPYLIWRDQRVLITSAGSRVNYGQVLDCIVEQKARFKIQAIGFDPYNAENLQNDLKAKAVSFGENQVIEVPQNYAQMSPASKDLEADVLGGLFDAGNNPLYAWAASNAIAPPDDKGNIFPSKKRSRGRIDPITATVIARAVYNRVGMTDKPKSIGVWVA